MKSSLSQLLLFLTFTHSILSAILPRRLTPAPFSQGWGKNMTLIDDEYIVVLHRNHTLEDHFSFIGTNLSNNTNFKHLKNFNIYRVGLDNDTLLHEIIRYDPGVRSVEQNGMSPGLEKQVVMETPRTRPSLGSRFSKIVRRWRVLTTEIPWNLAMLASWGKLPTPVQSDTKQILDGAGIGTNMYILDSGVKISHPILQTGGAAINFNDAQVKTVYCGVYETMDDLTGHGTHVSYSPTLPEMQDDWPLEVFSISPIMLILDKISGIAKQNSFGATIVNVKVLCGPNNSWLIFGLIEAIQDVVDQHNDFIAGKNTPPYWRGSVINMSFEGPGLNGFGFDAAIASAIAAGIPVVTSAGNDGQPQTTSPCGLPSVICVGATNKYYGRPDYTNYGPNVTVWAPGDTINSSTINPSYPYLPDSGTSQAAPHVTGIVANFIAFENLRNDFSTVLSRLYANAQTGVLSKYMGAGSPDLLANYGLSSPNRIPQYPYAGPQRELVKDANPIVHLNTFTLDGSGATATVTSAAFPVQDPPSAATGIDFEGPLNSLGPETAPPSIVVVTSTIEVSPSPVPAKARRHLAR